MNSQSAIGSQSNSDLVRDAEATLRLIANLPAPKGIEGRVISGLRSAPPSSNVLSWPRMLPPNDNWFRSAAAAAIVCVVVGGGWGIYSRVQSNNAKTVIPHAGPVNGFSNAGAVRVPQTLPAPVVAQPLKVEPAKMPHSKLTPRAKHSNKAGGLNPSGARPSLPADR